MSMKSNRYTSMDIAEKNISFKVNGNLHTDYKLLCVKNHKEMKTEFIAFMQQQILAEEDKQAKAKVKAKAKAR